ncbi:MAG TPA: VWA domain-containing protein [Candidatus Acidoferrales bacterium]|nr:VWA domain-containing protein [Candidatus Acidoferrales bacterium]
MSNAIRVLSSYVSSSGDKELSSGRKRALRAAALSATFAVLTVCCRLASAAQKSSQTTSDQGSAEKNTLRVRTNVVIVRVVVRDAKGNPVGGLARGDFHVLDDKKEQRITYFLAETPSAVSVAPEAPATGVKNSVAANSAAPIAEPVPQRYTALFFDDYHMAFANLVQIREAVKRFVDKNLDRGARVAMYSTSGKVHLDFTNDRAKLERAASQLEFDFQAEPPQECPPMTDLQAQEMHDKPVMMPTEGVAGNGAGGRRASPHSAGLASAEAIGPLAIAEAVAGVLGCSDEGDQGLEARAGYIARYDSQDAQTTLKALDGLVERMAHTPGGERTIAMVSEGFLNEQYEQQLNALIDRALRDKVIVNALDAVGLYSPEERIYAMLPPRIAQAYANLRLDTVNFDADVMARVAEGTGGIFIKNNNDFEGGLEKMSAPYTTYVLGFSPTNLKFNGKFHALKVDLPNFRTYTVQARRGYFAPKQAEDFAAIETDELEQAVFSQDHLNELPVRFFSSSFAKSKPQATKFSVTIYIDMTALRFRKEHGWNLDEVKLMLALFDVDGNYVTGQTKTVNMKLSDSTLKRLKSTGATVTVALTVKPGSYLMREVMLDADSQQLGSSTENITIP